MESGLVALLDKWYEVSGRLVDGFVEECSEGDINGWFRGIRVGMTGFVLAANLDIERFHDLSRGLLDKVRDCLDLTLLWQAEVTTQGGGLVSEIMLGAEASLNPVERRPDGMLVLGFLDVASGMHEFYAEAYRIDLEVEHVFGFWEDTCVGSPGVQRSNWNCIGRCRVWVPSPMPGLPRSRRLSGSMTRSPSIAPRGSTSRQTLNTRSMAALSTSSTRSELTRPVVGCSR
jgi:hypothetical protein